VYWDLAISKCLNTYHFKWQISSLTVSCSCYEAIYDVECAKDRNDRWVEEEVLVYCGVSFENFQELNKTNVYGWSLTIALNLVHLEQKDNLFRIHLNVFIVAPHSV
jgi:hypothetical protein